MLFTLLTLASWKPMVARSKAIDRASATTAGTRAMLDRAEELRELMHAQHALVCAAENPVLQAEHTRALQATLAELDEIVEAVQPRYLEVDEALAEAEAWASRMPKRRATTWFRRSTVNGLTSLAVAVAGERGGRLRDTWMADLAGAPEEGLTMGRWQQVGHAAGFVIAAVRMRGRAVSAPLWRPVDWLLVSESRTRTVTTLAVGAQVVYIQKQDGLHGLLTDGWGWCAGCALALTAFFRWLRRLRGVELAGSDGNSTAD
ncbi:hypothetical protein ACIQB5_03375 [Streptomyces sp. NPDC088560]|uniref:hypothetical protein n=1 Tax=Streptomyces sp. NPDC088560 TaxID=3365868 RepID=UPI00380B1A56